MALGLLLARSGVETLVLEKRKDFPADSQGETLLPSTLAAFDALGLFEQLLALPHNKAGVLSAEVGGRSYPFADFSRLPARPRFAVSISRSDFLGFLAAEGARYPAFTLLVGAEIDAEIERAASR